MSKFKRAYIACEILGTTAAILGGFFLYEGLIPKLQFNTFVRGTCLVVGGMCLQNLALNFKLKSQVEEDINQTLKERLQAIPKPCRGCRNFHGLEYGGVKLICAIHPQGVEGDTCPDYEKFSKP
ncbi:hypothetical protein [Nostoc sp. FACHB-110]|uniref:hypothetical protein n=1 Tax=Nostoc sp. FACHB-110 TaxID=2692834 RepID=UPI00168A2DCD|nr:hypothetical protein [Nostoc sp. FACHB-110]MBD2440604.1 hypothetical protein [Nostoc sp. FACHB-110]